jgi:hypothetical protein
LVGGGGAGVGVGGGIGVLVAGGGGAGVLSVGGVSVDGGETGVGEFAGADAAGVSVGGSAGVGVDTSLDATGTDSPLCSGGTTTTSSDVGVKVGQGVRVGTEANPAVSPVVREPTLSVRPHPRLTTATARTSPKTILICLYSKAIVDRLSRMVWDLNHRLRSAKGEK